jgi:uncharacterized protein
LKFTRWVKTFSGEPFYRLAGSCRRCGHCCQSPAIQVSPLLLYLPLIRRLVLKWHQVVNGLELVREERSAGLMAFRCTHWDPATGLCDSYSSRPGMCRDYPGNLVYAADPELFETCGYRVVLKNAARMATALEEAGLSAETLAELKANLHITPENSPRSSSKG